MTIEQQHELIPMSSGERFRYARESKGWTLATAAKAINVKPEILIAIETEESTHIPCVYLKGYIRSYARVLGIPQEEVEQLLSIAQGANPMVQPVFKKGPPRNPIDRWFKSTSYVLASAVVIALVWQFTNEAVRFSQGDPVLRPAQAEDPGSNTGLTDENDGSPGSISSLNSTPTTAKTHLRASIASLNMATRQDSKSTPLLAESAWAAVTNHDGKNRQQDSLSTPVEALQIVASADSWVEIVDRNGESLEMDLLPAGSKRNYSGSAPFRMLLGRASSVEVFHNGEKVDLAPYTRGNVARLTLGTDENNTESAPSADPESQVMELPPADQG